MHLSCIPLLHPDHTLESYLAAGLHHLGMFVCACRASAWWLGENINFAANEFAWQQRLPPGALVSALMKADTTEAGQLAAAAAAANPLLAMALARLQRALLGGCWEVRMAAVQVGGRVGWGVPGMVWVSWRWWW
jgi:hypothetical protein